jgi:hypothetical protein
MDADFIFGKEYYKHDLFQAFKKSIGYENDYLNECPVKQNTFTKYLKSYVKFKNKVYLERRTNGSDMIKISN